MKQANHWLSALTLIAMAAFAQNAWAAVCTSLSTGTWNTAARWSCGHVPVAADTVVIAHNITLNANPTVAGLTINAGQTLDDNGNGKDITVTGNVVNNGTYGVAGGGDLFMTGAGTTISGTGSFIDTKLTIDASNITLLADSTMNFASKAQIEVKKNVSSFTMAGTITDVGQPAGKTILKVKKGSTATISGTVNAPNSRIDLDKNTTLTNNGTVNVQSLKGKDATSVWTQGANSSLTVTQTSAGKWKGTLNASATGNTVTYGGTANPLTPSGNAYYHLTLSGSGNQTVPTGLTVAGNFTMSGTATTTAPAALTVGGNFIIGTGNTFTPGTGTVTLNGASIQTIGGGTTDLSLFNLTVNNPAGITLARNVIVTGALTGTVALTSTCPTDYTLTSNGGATVQHSCSISGPHHIRVQHDGNGLTCPPETLTVIACANAACTTPNYTASAVTGNVTWAGAPGGSVPFNITTGGTTTVNLSVTTVQTVTLGTSAVSPAPLNPSDCWNTTTATASCSLPFADSALLMSAPNHVSETVQNITISAVRKANNALNCVPAFASVSRAVNLKCAYTNPATGTLPVRVAGSALNAGNNAALACDATGQSPALAFNASGTATATLQYADAGQITLNATYTGSVGMGDAGLVMTGSGSFIAAPASFVFSAITAAPIKAGTNFNATVTAKNNAGNATPNFGKEAAPEGVTLSFSKYQPTGAGAVNGIFSGSVGAFSNGAATATNLNWSEVGTIDLTATLTSGSYLGSGFTATGTTGATGAVGRFIPDHFDTAIINGCLGCGFTYSGQPFTVYVTAMNGLATPTTIINYDGTASTSPNFAKAVTLSAWDAATGATQNPGPGSLLPPGNTAVALTAFSQGMASLNVAATMPFYTFTTVPTIPAIIRVRAVDTDNVTSLRVPLSSSTEGQPEIRSGRTKISNAYGSELVQLPITVTAQYWNASSNYVTSTTDSSSSFVVATPPATSAVNFGNYQKNLTTVSVVGSPKTVTFSSGVGGFTLAAPGAGKNGSVDMSIPSLTGASCYVAPIQLGCYLPSNTARATLGVYKGAKEFIYMRENY